MTLKIIFEQLNIPAQCKKYSISIWQCPQFLFLIMGTIIILTSIVTYLIGTHYLTDPLIVALIVLLITTVLFIISFVITQSFERLSEANRMKSEFINIVSHQLRTPITNLKWTLELLMSGKINSTSENQAEYLKILNDNINRMGELTKDLLIVSRLESAEFPLQKKEFSLEELVRNLIKEFQPLAQASNVEIKFSLKGDLPKVFADIFQIRLVCENLLDNAIRYIKGQGIVEIKIGKGNKKIFFEIKDNGMGIPKEDQKYIFQKFFRAKNIVQHQTQGTGLGLYIAKSIVENSGGKIWFKSEENKGSTFYFTLPSFD